MAKPILYIMTPSPPARAVLMLVRYLKLDVEVKSLDFTKKEHLSEEFVQVILPILEDLTLHESISA